eukprot:8518682-Pyramimonas_sp.AAC.1
MPAPGAPFKDAVFVALPVLLAHARPPAPGPVALFSVAALEPVALDPNLLRCAAALDSVALLGVEAPAPDALPMQGARCSLRLTRRREAASAGSRRGDQRRSA